METEKQRWAAAAARRARGKGGQARHGAAGHNGHGRWGQASGGNVSARGGKQVRREVGVLPRAAAKLPQGQGLPAFLPSVCRLPALPCLPVCFCSFPFPPSPARLPKAASPACLPMPCSNPVSKPLPFELPKTQPILSPWSLPACPPVLPALQARPGGFQ